MEIEELRAQILARFEAEVEPRLTRRKYDDELPGYNCCGCSTYEQIYEDMKAIVENTERD